MILTRGNRLGTRHQRQRNRGSEHSFGHHGSVHCLSADGYNRHNQSFACHAFSSNCGTCVALMKYTSAPRKASEAMRDLALVDGIPSSTSAFASTLSDTPRYILRIDEKNKSG